MPPSTVLSRSTTPYSSVSTSYQYGDTAATARSMSHAPSLSHGTTRSGSRHRRRRLSTGGSTIGGGESQHIICAVTESRGVSPVVGLAFINIFTGEAVLSQLSDTQFYVKSVNKLSVFDPTDILIMSTQCPPHAKSKMYSIFEENLPGSRIRPLDRKYWSETAGHEYIHQLALEGDGAALQVALEGKFFATCCFAAVRHLDVPISTWCSY